MAHIERLSRLRTRLRTEWFLRLYTEWFDDVMARRGHCTQRVIMVTALCSPDWPIFEDYIKIACRLTMEAETPHICVTHPTEASPR